MSSDTSFINSKRSVSFADNCFEDKNFPFEIISIQKPSPSRAKFMNCINYVMPSECWNPETSIEGGLPISVVPTVSLFFSCADSGFFRSAARPEELETRHQPHLARHLECLGGGKSRIKASTSRSMAVLRSNTFLVALKLLI